MEKELALVNQLMILMSIHIQHGTEVLFIPMNPVKLKPSIEDSHVTILSTRFNALLFVHAETQREPMLRLTLND